MSYIKQTWVDRAVEFFRRFSVTEDSAGNITLTEEPGIVTSTGTPLDATRLNHIENGIEEVSNNLNLVQSGGLAGAFSAMPFVGTAPIVESGSNANGSWIKYADGTMICSHATTRTGVNMTSVYGSLFRESGNAVWGFPMVFESLLFANVSGNYMCPFPYINSLSINSIAYRCANVTSQSAATVQLQFFAIGRWK